MEKNLCAHINNSTFAFPLKFWYKKLNLNSYENLTI